MTKEKERKILMNALATFGLSRQAAKAVEEMAELTCEIARASEGRSKVEDTIEEIADVSIMLDQLTIAFGTEKVQKVREKKLKRLNNRIRKEKKRRAKRFEEFEEFTKSLRKDMDELAKTYLDSQKEINTQTPKNKK